MKISKERYENLLLLEREHEARLELDRDKRRRRLEHDQRVIDDCDRRAAQGNPVRLGE